MGPRGAFRRFWLADGISTLGTATSTVAVPLLVIYTLHRGAEAIGLVRAAQWVPLLIVGPVAGVLADRVRRRRLLVGADLLSLIAFGAIAVLGLTGTLSFPLLLAGVCLGGVATAAFTGTHQSMVPDLVSGPDADRAYARLDQTWTGAQAAGPALGGILVQVVSAPFAVLVDAISYAVSAVLLTTLRITEQRPEPQPDATRTSIWQDLREGARWVYGHREIRPYALALHLWFLGNAAGQTVLVLFAVRTLGLGAALTGIALATAGVAGVAGGGLSNRVAGRIGLGRTCVLADALTPLAYVAAILAALAGPLWLRAVVLIAGQLAYGFGLGLKGPIESNWRNAATPARLRGRMNSTIRSVNWGGIAVAGPVAGAIAAGVGTLPVLVIAAAVTALSAALLALSPFAQVRAVPKAA